MPTLKELHIRCLNCNKVIKFPVLFRKFDSIVISEMEGEQVECPHCGKNTGCNKENMRFRV
jgi:DNA-directed RNA polymerase subunit RPC12/RpoP